MDAATPPAPSAPIAIEISLRATGYAARSPLVDGLVATASTRAEVIAAMTSALTERFTWSPVPAGDLTAVEVVTIVVPLPTPPSTVLQRPPGWSDDRPPNPEAAAATVVTTDSYLQALRITPAEEIATAALYQLERRFTGILQLLALRSIPDMDREAIIAAVHTQAYQGRIELFDYLRETLIPELRRHAPLSAVAQPAPPPREQVGPVRQADLPADTIDGFFAAIDAPTEADWRTKDYAPQHILIPPLTWDHCALERQFGITLPSSMVAFWQRCSGVVLHYHPQGSGLVVWSPDMVVSRHPYFAALHEGQLRPGDLVIGEFLGQSAFLVLRCDPRAADFGAVVIGEGIDHRPDWQYGHYGLGVFLAAFVHTQHVAFWTPQTEGPAVSDHRPEKRIQQ